MTNKDRQDSGRDGDRSHNCEWLFALPLLYFVMQSTLQDDNLGCRDKCVKLAHKSSHVCGKYEIFAILCKSFVAPKVIEIGHKIRDILRGNGVQIGWELREFEVVKFPSGTELQYLKN